MPAVAKKKPVRRRVSPKKAAAKKASRPKVTSKAGAAISDVAVLKATGRTTAQWFDILDARAKARSSHDHKDAAAHLHADHACPEWWCQMVTVLYERDRGHRAKHQRPDGYSISASRTVAVPLPRLYQAWSDKQVSQWLKSEPFTVRKATKDRSMRITWPDGTNLEVMFYAKGAGKSQVTVQHSKLKSAAAGEKLKKYWAGTLDVLVSTLTPAK